MRRYLWLFPLILMALAALACDAPYYNPPHVSNVEADPATPGKAYALVEGGETTPQSYETIDYGASWRAAEHSFSDAAHTNNFSMSGDTLTRNGIPLWSFPRPTFRSFFNLMSFDDTPSNTPHFVLPSTPETDISPADPTVIYVTMGTQGVLVGPNPSVQQLNPRPWVLTYKGIDAIHPLPLTITNPLSILGIVLWAMIVPPLALLHAWLLAQAWRYAFPIGESNAALRLARRVSFGIAGLAMIAVVVWLIDVQTDYYPVVGVMTVVTIAISVGAAIRLGRSRGFSDGFVRRLALATGLLSLAVPIGVAAVWFAWPVIITLIVSFVLYRHCLESYLDRAKAKIGLWQLDRLTLEIMAVFAVMLIPLGGMAFGVTGLLFSPMRPSGGEWPLLMAVIVILISVTGLRAYIGWRGGQLVVKKKNASPGEVADAPLFQGMGWWGTLLTYTIVSIIGAAALSGVVFFGQTMAYGWFQTLLISR